VIFEVFFVLLNNFWIVFLELFRIENKFKKNKPYPTGPSPNARPNLHPPSLARPPGPSASHGRRRLWAGPPRARPHKRGGRALACRLLRLALTPLPRRPAPSPPRSCQRRPWSPNRAAGVDLQSRPLPLLSSAGEHSIFVLSFSSSFFPRRPSS
jgi:hypothetical protein